MWVYDDLLGIKRGPNEFLDVEAEHDEESSQFYSEMGKIGGRIGGKVTRGRRKKCVWEGTEYNSIQDLANHMGVSRTTALMRLRKRDGTYRDPRSGKPLRKQAK